MRRALCLLSAAFLLLPAVHAGTSAAPEVVDPDDATVASLDVLAAWWTKENDSRLSVTLQVEDLAFFGQPLLDPDHPRTDVRHYYQLDFSAVTDPTLPPLPLYVRCVVGLVETSPVKGTRPIGGNFGGTVGTECVSTPILAHHNREAFRVTTRLDALSDQLTVVLEENGPPVLDLRPGLQLLDLRVRTATGAATAIGVGHDAAVQDLAGPGAPFTM